MPARMPVLRQNDMCKAARKLVDWCTGRRPPGQKSFWTSMTRKTSPASIGMVLAMGFLPHIDSKHLLWKNDRLYQIFIVSSV
jgi:hypothetical protein